MSQLDKVIQPITACIIYLFLIYITAHLSGNAQISHLHPPQMTPDLRHSQKIINARLPPLKVIARHYLVRHIVYYNRQFPFCQVDTSPLERGDRRSFAAARGEKTFLSTIIHKTAPLGGAVCMSTIIYTYW